ncbi:hypothetical protein [Legionella bozemanae]|uniref:hypothetical protein n=1 Tax=Legionella bozemanae TaxID=447 RepID=UPI00216AD812|nr:hypothetical protein [Legionella bozemanae]
MPFRINNPGGGDCGFYAFSIGLINAIQEEYNEHGKSEIFDLWKSKGLNNVSLQEILDIDLHKLYDSPYTYKKETLLKLQMSLRGIATTAYKHDLFKKIAEAKSNGSTQVESSPVYHKFMELVHYYLDNEGTLDKISQFNELALSPKVLALAKKTAASLKPMLKNQTFAQTQKIENAYVKEVFLKDVLFAGKENPSSVILKGIEKIKEQGRWATHADLNEVADQLKVNLYVTNQLNGEPTKGWSTIVLNNEGNAHWTTNVKNIPGLVEADELLEVEEEEDEYEMEEHFLEIEKREFLIRLSQMLSDPNKIDKAVLERKVAKVKNTFGASKFASLYELDAYGVFNPDGSINKDVAAEYEITFNESQIKTRLESYGFKHISLREMIIFESALHAVTNELTRETKKKTTGLARECFAGFRPPALFRLANPLSMELAGPTRQMVNMGYFKFKDTNISISPGPNSSSSFTSVPNSDSYEAERDIARYLNNLLTNNVAHVFAMGRVFPYYPQNPKETSDKREIRTDAALNDFINYFIPDANGQVTLPNIPELEDIHIMSRPIKKVGRFITYEISINGNAPIQVHHFPLRNEQPLVLTEDELAYIQKVSQTTLPEHNIHAHCRKGTNSSAQIAYLLASLNPKYRQLSRKEQLVQMRAEKTPHGKPEYFIETDLQQDYVEKASESLLRGHIAFLEDEDMEIYIVYGILLKQEIDQLLQLFDTPKPKLTEAEHTALLELMEKYQELSSTPLAQLPKWVEDVCKNPMLSKPTITLFESIKSANDFLLYCFAEKRNLDELEVFFDLQTHNKSYLDLLSQLEEILPDHIRMEQEQFDSYKSSFKAHAQNAYLKNSRNLNKPNKIQLKIDVLDNISATSNKILDALINHHPKKAEFDNLKKEYYQCKQRIELLKKAELNDEDQEIDEELERRIEVIEHIFLLGYDHLPVESDHITEKMHLIYEQLSELIDDNKLSPRQWNALKKQFNAFKIIFDFTKPAEMETPDIFSTLDTLFQGKREHTTHLFTLFNWRVLQAKPRKENLEDFVAGLSYAVLDALIEALPQKYYGENTDAIYFANGIYSKEINLLLDDILKLAANYEKPNEQGIIKLTQKCEIPTQEEYEKAQQKVIELIEKHLPFLVTSTDFGVLFENLVKDFLRIDFQSKAPEFEELKNRFAELKLEYQNHDKNEIVEHLIKKIEQQIKDEAPDTGKERQYRESKENVLRIKAIRSAAIREAQDEIPFFESRIEPKIPKEIGYPKRPKLIVFNIDDVLIELNNGEMTRVQELINVLNYAKKYGMEIALASSHAPSSDDEKQSPLAQLRGIVEKNTEIDISNIVFFLDTLPLHHEKVTTAQYFQKKISQLPEQIDLLKNQIPTEKNLQELARQFPEEEDKGQLEQETKKLESKKKRLEETIRRLQAELDSLSEKLAKLTSDEFIHLDAIRHYHALRKPISNNDYYQIVEGGILRDFKNPELAGNLGIELERTEIWNNLFQLAGALLKAEYPELPTLKPSTARPSLQTILKDLIFNSDKPELLQKKYGDLEQLEEARQTIQDNKEYFIQHIPQIEIFYQSRLAHQKRMYERRISEKAVLNEEDVVFFDSHQNVLKQIHQRSNYRVIKVDNGEKKPFRHMVDLNYEMGAYNGIIAYLKGDEKNAPQHYGPNRINKTLSSYLTSIPGFTLSEFRHSPIVLHIEMSAILAKLPELSPEEKVQQRYKEQFFEAAIERFKQLPEASQDDFVTTYYKNVHQALGQINQELKQLISPLSPKLGDKLAELQSQIDKIIEMDKKFSQHISPTFLSSEAKLLHAMITEGLNSGNLDHLMVEADKVKFKTAHDKSRTQFYIESMMEDPDTYLRAHHSALEGVDVFDKEFITEQYTLYIAKHLKGIIKGNYSSLQAVLDAVQKAVTLMDPEKNDALVKNHHQLIVLRRLCEDLLPLIPYQTRVDELKDQPTVDYFDQVFELSGKITNYIDQIELSDEYQAKLFLDKAEKYLRTRNWNVGFQWNKHTITVGGKEKKIPATVAHQLEIIERARTDANYSYLEAKKEFLDIGKQKEISWRSSKVARSYYSLFKKKPDDITLEKDLNETFSPTSKT